MDKERRNELKNSYKSMPVVGGVYYIQCNGNGRKWLLSTVDMQSARHRFDFAVKINSAPDPKMRSEWQQYGIESFSFVCLEELKKGNEQTPREFASDVKTLYEILQEKLQQEETK